MTNSCALLLSTVPGRLGEFAGTTWADNGQPEPVGDADRLLGRTQPGAKRHADPSA